MGAVTYMGVAWLSDRQQRRGLYCVIFGCISVVGYGILLSNSPPGVHYFGYADTFNSTFILSLRSLTFMAPLVQLWSQPDSM